LCGAIFNLHRFSHFWILFKCSLIFFETIVGFRLYIQWKYRSWRVIVSVPYRPHVYSWHLLMINLRIVFKINNILFYLQMISDFVCIYSESIVLGAWSWAYRTVSMFIPDIYQNDCDEKLNQKKFTVTRQERNFHCMIEG